MAGGHGRLGWRALARRKAGIGIASLAAFAAVATASLAAGMVGGDEPTPITKPIWHSTYDWAGGDGYAGWNTRTRTDDENAYRFFRNLGGQPGLWLWPAGDRRYERGSAEWVLRAPGTTRIARAQLTVAHPDKLFAHHCLRIGLRAGDDARDVRTFCKPPVPPATQADHVLDLADPSGNPAAKEVFVQLVMPACEKPATACAKWIPVQDPRDNGAYVRLKSAELTLVDDDDPIVTPSKAFYDLDDTYIDGRQTYPLRIKSEDAGAGVTRIDVTHTGWPGPQPPLAEHAVACDPHHHTAALGSRICPPEDAIDLEVDTRPMPEGTRRFRAGTPDPAGNVGSAGWTVIIDRTPPGPPQDLRFTRPEEGSGQAAWDAASDPVLPDGTPGSGVAGYLERHRVADGDWSDWQRSDADARLGEELYDHPAGTALEFELKAVDAVGNVGEPAQVRGEVEGAAPSVTAAGRLFDVRDHYVGSENAGVTVTADDGAGAGVRRVWLERDDAGEIASADAGCTPRTRGGRPWKAQCPRTADGQFTVDTGSLPEGLLGFVAGAVDRPHNVSRGLRWSVLVDHTPPPAPRDLSLDFDPQDGSADVQFEQDDDPDLADGNPGSGVDTWEFRYRLPGAAWSDSVSDDAFTIPAASEGSSYEVEIKAVDNAGNESVTRQTLTISPGDAYTQAEIDAFDNGLVTAQDLENGDPNEGADQYPDDEADYQWEYEQGPHAAARTASASISRAHRRAHGPTARKSVSASGCYTIFMVEWWRPDLSLKKCPERGSARKKSKGKRERLRCSSRLARAIGRRTKRPCDSNEDTWQWVYLLREYTRTGPVFYVGQSLEQRYEARCRAHKLRFGPETYCQRVMRLPNLAYALAVEQALMTVYGFGNRRIPGLHAKTNVYLPSGMVWPWGWFNGRPPVLANARWNVTNRIASGVPYCVTLAAGFGALALYPPEGLDDFPVGSFPPVAKVYPPGTRYWWPNFPGYACGGRAMEVALMDTFRFVEGRRPALDPAEAI